MTALADQLLENPPISASVDAPRKYNRAWSASLLGLDVIMFVGSAYAAIRIVGFFNHNVPQEYQVYLSAAIFIAIWLLVFERVGLYRQSFALSIKDEFYCTVAALSVGILPQLILFTLVPMISTSRLALIVSLLFSIVTVGSTRALAHAVRNAYARRRPRRVAIVGQLDRIETVAKSLNLAAGSHVMKFEWDDVDEAVERIDLSQDPQLNGITWFREAQLAHIDEIILTEILSPELMPHLLAVADRNRMKIAFAPPRLKRQAYDLSFETEGHQALLVPSPLRACRPPAKLLKRIIDVIVASIMLAIFSPVMSIVALLIWLEESGPVLYRQERVTRGGEVFDILKFRTMPMDAENATGPIWTQQGDNRATKLGAILRKTSLDELPQLFNVLRGEMSVVGPRPERPVFVELFRSYLPRYDERHLVRPGITGWSHVQMRRGIGISDISERLSHDLYYVENWSLFMDCSVLLKTAAEFLFHKAP